MQVRFLPQECQRFAYFSYALLIQGAAAGDQAEARGAFSFSLQSGLEAGFRADPGESLAAGLPMRGLSAPFAILRTESALGIDDPAEIKTLGSKRLGHFVGSLVQFIARRGAH